MKAAEKAEWDALTPAEKDKFLSLDLFDEDRGRAMDQYGRIVRKDIFKGYTAAQRKRIIQENEAVLQQKREREQSDTNSKAEWNMQQTMVQRALDQV